MKYYIKLFGVERSGANFVAELVKQNFDKRRVIVLNNMLGKPYNAPILHTSDIKKWLKTCVKPTPQIVRICRDLCNKKITLIPIIITKNPYSWAKSIYRWRRTRYLNYEYEFDLYNVNHKIYHAIINHPEEFELYDKGFIFKYEDIIKNYKLWINTVSNLLGINHNKKLNIPEYNLAYKFTEKDRQYYLNGEPFGLSEVEINKITLLTNWSLITNCYNYKPIDPRDYYELSRQGLAKLTYEMRKSGVLKILNEYGKKKQTDKKE